MHRFLAPLGFATLLFASVAEAGFPIPAFNDDPLRASSLWTLALPLASSLLVRYPGDATNVSANTLNGTSGLSDTDSRRLIAARDDAAAFIASAGEHRSALLEQALHFMRGLPALAGQDDLQLAAQVLIYSHQHG